MKTVKINLYKWNELSKETKEKIFENGSFDFSGTFDNDFENTLNKFCSIFDIIVKSYDVQYNCISYDFDNNSRFENEPENAALWIPKILWNDFEKYLYDGKYYSKSKYENGKYNYISRRSKVIFDNDCVLTGICFDYDILQNIYDCMNYKKEFSSIRELFDSCFDRFFKVWNENIDYENSFEFFDDMMQANYDDTYFTENGDIWKE